LMGKFQLKSRVYAENVELSCQTKMVVGTSSIKLTFLYTTERGSELKEREESVIKTCPVFGSLDQASPRDCPARRTGDRLAPNLSQSCFPPAWYRRPPFLLRPVGIGNMPSWQTPSMWPSQFPHVSLAYEFVFIRCSRYHFSI
jgi:hypothetical protein